MTPLRQLDDLEAEFMVLNCAANATQRAYEDLVRRCNFVENENFLGGSIDWEAPVNVTVPTENGVSVNTNPLNDTQPSGSNLCDATLSNILPDSLRPRS